VRAIADGLSAAGFGARLDDPQATGAVTITVCPPGRKEADIILDDDGYAELRWWPGPDATPTDVTDLIARLLTIIAAPPVAQRTRRPPPPGPPAARDRRSPLMPRPQTARSRRGSVSRALARDRLGVHRASRRHADGRRCAQG
jgi:hypothetical protein